MEYRVHCTALLFILGYVYGSKVKSTRYEVQIIIESFFIKYRRVAIIFFYYCSFV